MTAAPHPSSAAGVPPWRDVRVLRLAAQAVVVIVVAVLAAWMIGNFLAATSERGLGFGFSFLGRSAGFDISESPIPYSPTDTYARAFLVGLLNTLIVSVLGIILSTILGVDRRRGAPLAELARPAHRVGVRRDHPQHAAARSALHPLLRRLPAAAGDRPGHQPAGLDLRQPARRLPARAAGHVGAPGVAGVRRRRRGRARRRALARRAGSRTPGGRSAGCARSAGSRCWRSPRSAGC